MIKAKYEDGKLSIPYDIIQEAGLREGDEVEVGPEAKGIISLLSSELHTFVIIATQHVNNAFLY